MSDPLFLLCRPSCPGTQRPTCLLRAEIKNTPSIPSFSTINICYQRLERWLSGYSYLLLLQGTHVVTQNICNSNSWIFDDFWVAYTWCAYTHTHTLSQSEQASNLNCQATSTEAPVLAWLSGPSVSLASMPNLRTRTDPPSLQLLAAANIFSLPILLLFSQAWIKLLLSFLPNLFWNSFNNETQWLKRRL